MTAARAGVALVVAGLVVLALALVVYRSGSSPPAATARTCLSPGSGPSPTTPIDPTGAGETARASGTTSRGVPLPPPLDPRTHFAAGRTPVCGFGEVRVVITDATGHRRVHCLLAAVTEAQQERGLMKVTDATLGGYDGMVFQFPVDQTGGFYMRDTPMPLSITYFDVAGRVVSQTNMTPCGDRVDCPTYPPARPFRSTLEVPAERRAEVGVDPRSTLAFGRAKEACPAA